MVKIMSLGGEQDAYFCAVKVNTKSVSEDGKGRYIMTEDHKVKKKRLSCRMKREYSNFS